METGERKLDSNARALRRSRCLGVKTLRVGNGDTNLRVQQSLEIVNRERSVSVLVLI